MTGHDSALERYLHILAGAHPTGRLIEIRSSRLWLPSPPGFCFRDWFGLTLAS